MLARILLKEMDADALTALRNEPLLEVWDRLRPGCATYLRDTAWTDEALDELAASYCTLFVLPGGVTPYAAAWLEGDPALARSAFADRINEVLDALRVQPADFGMGNMPTDHVGVLLALHAVALERGGDALGARSLALLVPWGADFAERLSEMAAEHDALLYEVAGRLLSVLLEPPEA